MRGSSKADVSMNTISFVAIVIIISIIAVIALYHWFEGETIQTTQATCIMKLTNYCLEWAKTNYGDAPYDWNSKSPFNCEQVNVAKPESSKACIGLS